VLEDAYAEPPFRLGRSFADGEGLHMIMASTSPGVFGGDDLQQNVRIGRGARVRLTSQSALQVHAVSSGAVARSTTAYHVEDHAWLHCSWDPMIPFADARFDQRIEVHIAETSHLYWSDAQMAGRHARGERWRFAAFRHELRVLRAGSLDYLERYRIAPHDSDPTRLWSASDAVYLGTTFVSGDDIKQDAEERLHAQLTAIAGVRSGVSRIARRLLLVRLTGRSGPSFHDARACVNRALA